MNKINPLSIYLILFSTLIGYLFGNTIIGLLIGIAIYIILTIIAKNDL